MAMITDLENTNRPTTSEYRKTYFETNKKLILPYACMELMSEYFEIKRDRFLKEAKEQLQANYNQQNEIKIFIKNEIKEFKGYRNKKKELIQNTILEKTHQKTSLKQKRYINFLKEQLKLSELQPQQLKTKAEILREQLELYGFFELEKIKALSEQSKISIIEKISESGLPYAIAMFDYLQFIQYLEKKHFSSKYELNKGISKWFYKDKDGRAVKGNISSLLKNTTENKSRYTAHKYEENVINDYEQLK